ncbi:hypothetical protein FQA47_019559 [Oryzias melastigma]|uniref:Uncharacterized protein n=1 Tax=Oryzias melastigma TaxID=30732 RepID=A0A834C8Z1_ORYME|nr:hypothetical protein FQA47_019559 [Oryzias melastigma]
MWGRARAPPRAGLIFAWRVSLKPLLNRSSLFSSSKQARLCAENQLTSTGLSALCVRVSITRRSLGTPGTVRPALRAVITRCSRSNCSLKTAAAAAEEEENPYLEHRGEGAPLRE